MVRRHSGCGLHLCDESLSKARVKSGQYPRKGVILHEAFFEHESNRVSSLDPGSVLWITGCAHRLSPQSCQRRKNLATALDRAHLRHVVQPESHCLARVHPGADRETMDDDAAGDGLPDLLP